MNEQITIPKEDLDRLQERLAKLAGEKSYLQLVNHLMNSLSAVPGLDQTADSIVKLIMENIGGSNISLYYPINSNIYFVDVFGSRKVLDEFDDEMVQRAFEHQECVEVELHFDDTMMTTPRFARASKWALPLIVGARTIGVLKMEGMLIGSDEVSRQLQAFFNYAALVLNNEIENFAKLRDANDKLKLTNEDLKRETIERASQQAFLTVLLESIDLGIVACDSNGILTLFNRKAREIHGPTKECISADRWAQVCHIYQPDGRTPMRDEDTALYRALQGERVTNQEVVIVPPGAEPRTLLTGGQRITDARGRTLGAVVGIADISDRKALETQLRHAQKLESVGQLAAGIAHEINTPAQFVGDNVFFLRDAVNELQLLIGRYREQISVLLRQHTTEDPQSSIAGIDSSIDLDFLKENIADAFRAAFDGVASISSVVSAIKEFAQPESRDMTAVDLNHSIMTTLTIARNEYSRVADIVTELSPIPPVMCHAGDINQVFLNLIVNSAHAIADVAGETGKRGRICVRSRFEGGAVRIEFEDNGAGIPENIRNRVFDPFFTTKAVGKGTGAGLAIAWSVVVNKHHGLLSFTSEVGKGTTFVVQLPAVVEQEAENLEPASM